MQSFTPRLLTVCFSDFRVWLGDVLGNFADVPCCEATDAQSTGADTPVYYPSCHSSDLVRDSFIDLWSYRTGYFDPYLAVACQIAVRERKGFEDSDLPKTAV